MSHFVYLASKSPRRRELLNQIGIDYQLLAVETDETPALDELPDDLVKRLALQKAQAGLDLVQDNRPILGSDTIVVCQGQILGKPTDKQDAFTMLKLLSGSTHQVMTAVALVNANQQLVENVVTEVSFKTLTEQEIVEYWQSGEPVDKAGSYGIQGLAGQFVTNINGSYPAVVGLPLFETRQLLSRFELI